MLTDINECEKEATCPRVGGRCINTPGSYQCECLKGYQLREGACIGTYTFFQPQVAYKILLIT